MSVIYLKTQDVALIHFIIMKKYGEGEQAGIKDLGLLESVVQSPQQSAFQVDAYDTFFQKVAALFEPLARNHCFYNGNKRTAFAATDLFLKKNGYKLKKNDCENEDFTVTIAEGKATLPCIAKWLEANSRGC